MAFTATINSISPNPDGTGAGVNMLVQVTFADSASLFTFVKTYTFPTTETVNEAKTVIQNDGAAMKTQLGQIGTLQSAVGTVVTL